MEEQWSVTGSVDLLTKDADINVIPCQTGIMIQKHGNQCTGWCTNGALRSELEGQTLQDVL